jgi:hypothetical protein
MRSSTKLYRALALAIILTMALPWAVFADDVVNNLPNNDLGATLEVMNLTAGGATGSTDLNVIATSNDGKSGCNFTNPNHALTLHVSSSNTNVATVSPSQFTITRGPSNICSTTHTITVTPVGGGTANITFSEVSNNTGGTFNLQPAAFQVVVAKQNQTITFNALADKTYGDAGFTVSATASSGLPVSFAADGDCSISGSTVSITGAGTCTITASQAGNSVYNAAPNVQRTFAINKANQSITFDPLPDRTYGDPDFTVSATASSGLPVSFSASGDCEVNGDLVSLTGAGDCTITASQAGNANYNAAPNVARSFNTGKQNQTIIFDPLADKTYGDADFTVSASASSGLDVSFSASGDCTVSGDLVSITGAGSCTITASQAGDDNYNAAPDVEQTFGIAKADQTIDFDPLADATYGDADFTVSATASSGLPISFSASGDCEVNGDLVSITGAGECTITASQAGDDNYNAAPDVPQSFNIAKANQTIAFDPLAGKTWGDPDFTVSATASSGLAVSFSASGDCTVSGDIVSLTGAGDCTITASQAGDSNYNAAADVEQSFSIAKADQAITFGALDDTTWGSADFTVSATASSGLPVSFAADGDCTISGDVVSLTGAGDCTITASQGGDDNYNPAPDVVRSFNIAKANQTIAFGPLADKTWGDADFTVSATASSGLAVSFAAVGDCTVSGNLVSITNPGNCTIIASQEGNNNYNPAPDVEQSFAIGKLDQTIDFGPLADATYGDADFTVSASASSGLPVSFSADGDCEVNGDLVTITGAGECTITASQAGDGYYNAAPDVDQTFTIAKADQTITFDALADMTYGDADFALGATASSGLAVSYSASGDCEVNGDLVTITGAGSCTITASQAGDDNYNAAADVEQTFGIAKADQTISFDPLADATYGDADFTVSASASSGLPVSFSVSGNCTIAGDIVTITGAGSCTVTASQAGDENYNAADDVEQSFSIAKADQTIDFGPLADKSYGDPDFTVSATASSGLAVSFAVSGSCAISGDLISITGAGSCTVTASQAGDANYNAAPDVEQSFNIDKLGQTIDFDPLADKTYGDADFTVIATASSGLPVSFSASGNCEVNGDLVSITGAGSCTITASQAGDEVYAAAADVEQTFGIAKADQTIDFGALADATYGDADFTVSASASSGLPVSYSASGNCEVNGDLVSITGAGDCTITASQAGDDNYNAADDVEQTFNIAKADQTITFDALADKAYGAPDFTVSASASSGLPVSFSASGNCTVTGDLVSLGEPGDCTITASQEGDDNYNAAADVEQSFTIGKLDQTIDFGPLADKTYGDADFTVSATASSGLAVSFAAAGDCTIAGDLVTITGAGECTITASQAGDDYYNAAADVEQTFGIAKADQTIDFGPLADKTYGDADFTVSATASSGLAVSFSAFGDCEVTGSVVSLTGVGGCTITASQAGDSNYNAAADVPQSFAILDGTAPVISGMPDDIVAEATGPDGAVVNWTAPTANDAVDGPVPVICDPDSGSLFPLGTTTVTCTAEDTAGNQASETFEVTVVDTTAPVTAATRNPNTTWSRTDVTVSLSASDVASGVASITYSATGAQTIDSTEVVGDATDVVISAEGLTTLSFYATDNEGNVELAKTVEVRIDRTGPVITNPQVAFASAMMLASPSISYQVSWDAADSGIGLDRYQVHRSADGGATWVAVGTTFQQTMTVTIPAGNEARFRVRGLDQADNVGDWVTFPVRTDLLVQDSDTTLVGYAGNWTNTAIASGSGGTITQSSTTNSIAKLQFTGNYVTLVMPTGSTYGIAAVSVDGSFVANVDLYSPTLKVRQVVFQHTLGNAGPHTIEVRVTGSKNAASRSTTVALDAIIVAGAVAFETAPPTVTPAAVTFTATMLPTTGNSLPLVASWSATDASGVADYDVQRSTDGVNWQPVLTQTSLQSMSLTVQSGDPLYLRVRARDTLGNESGWVVSGPFTTSLLQETNPAIVYSGVWKPTVHATDSFGEAIAANSPTSTATLTFTGKEIALVMPTTVAMGIVEVSIDGTVVGTIDTYSATAKRRQVVFHHDFGTAGTHTITVRATGTKNPSGLGTWIYLDAFVVLN